MAVDGHLLYISRVSNTLNTGEEAYKHTYTDTHTAHSGSRHNQTRHISIHARPDGPSESAALTTALQAQRRRCE